MPLYELQPDHLGQNHLAPNCTVVGDVVLGTSVTVGHGTVIRGDINGVR